MVGIGSLSRVVGKSVVMLAMSAVTAACTGYGSSSALHSFAQVDVPVAPAEAVRIELGRSLFFDRRLSGSNDISCASCHRPDHGFEDGRRVPIGTQGRLGQLSTPTLMGVSRLKRLMWNGRARSLEAQALMPISNPNEMGQDLTELPAELRADPQLRAAFAVAFPASGQVSNENLARALAAYQRTIRPSEAPFDRFVSGDATALSAPARRGFDLFMGKGGCARCHSGPLLSDGRLHDVGLPDRGRGTRFKTPTLRDLSRRAPYMHDGSMPTLASVLDHYTGGAVQRQRVPRPVKLDVAERADLLMFLQSLDSEDER